MAGQHVTYTLAVRNNGPSSAAGPIIVHDALPVGMTYVSATGPGWACTGVGTSTVTCTRAAGLVAGAAAPDITLVADVAPDAGPATLVNIANVNGPDTDIDLGNNADPGPHRRRDQANISLTKTTTGDNPVSAGDTTAFTIVVHNDGPSDADAVTVTDQLPAGLTLVSVCGDGWTCYAERHGPVHARDDRGGRDRRAADRGHGAGRQRRPGRYDDHQHRGLLHEHARATTQRTTATTRPSTCEAAADLTLQKTHPRGARARR